MHTSCHNSFADCAVDAIVVGGGVVGIAVARELAAQGLEVIVVERETRIGQHQSARNSGVIHAGFYYPEGSLKARLCHQAKLELYRYAEARGIAHRRVGKLVVASDETQLPKLKAMLRHAVACGVNDIELLDARQAKAMEPEVACVAALWSPSTGVIDTSALMLSLVADAESRGVVIAQNSRVLRGHAVAGGWRLLVDSGGQVAKIACRLMVNSAGIDAPDLARRLDGYPASRVPESYLAKGNFFACQGGTPFSRLIYPLPGPIGLGVHLTLDLDGQAKFGPDVQIVEAVSYDVDPDRSEAFYASIRNFWPGLRDGALTPAYSGIRAKIGRPGASQDWVVETPYEHGVPGLVNLFGIETPGMTCCMSIGAFVAERVRNEAFA
jgi:L-2-hydroxyglutarate oxidase LhgO